VQIGAAEPKKIAEQMRAARGVAENVDDINSAIVYLAKQNQREEDASSAEKACESTDASSGSEKESSPSTAALYADMGDVRGRMFIEVRTSIYK
jgi:hypothetical protein